MYHITYITPSKAAQDNLAKLNAMELTDSSSRNLIVSSVKQMYERGKIKTYSAAVGLMNLIQNDNIKEFDKRVNKMEKQYNPRKLNRLQNQ